MSAILYCKIVKYSILSEVCIGLYDKNSALSLTDLCDTNLLFDLIFKF